MGRHSKEARKQYKKKRRADLTKKIKKTANINKSPLIPEPDSSLNDVVEAAPDAYSNSSNSTIQNSAIPRNINSSSSTSIPYNSRKPSSSRSNTNYQDPQNRRREMRRDPSQQYTKDYLYLSFLHYSKKKQKLNFLEKYPLWES